MNEQPKTWLVRDRRRVEVPTPMWAEMLKFLTQCGWKPSVPAYSLFADRYAVKEKDAQSLAAAGEVALDESLRNPAGALGAMRFDWGKFAEIVTFAAEGSFTLEHAGET